MAAPYPEADAALINPFAEAELAMVMGCIIAIRNLRAEMNVPPAVQVQAYIHSSDAQAIQGLHKHRQSISLLAKVADLHFNNASGPPPSAGPQSGCGCCGYLPAPGRDHRLYRREARLSREIEKLGKDLTAAQRKLSNEDFLGKAPAQVSPERKRKAHRLDRKTHQTQEPPGTD